MDQQALQAMRASPAEFRARLLIDTDAGPQPLGAIMDDWQRKDFEALDLGWHKACGHRVDAAAGPVYQRAYFERPRGHSKTADLGVMATWALFASSRRLRGIAASGDKDQAKLLRDAIEQLTRLNPWLTRILDVQAYKIQNTQTGAELEIISSDAATSYGSTPDFVIVDELTHWVGGEDETTTTRTGGRKLWTSLISAAAKRGHCMVVVIANAGLGKGTSWQWRVRETAREDPTWRFSRLDGPVASWLTPERLEEQRRFLSTKAYQRLWENLWTSGTGDALDEQDIQAAITLVGSPGRESECGYIAGLDLGVKSDHAALVVLGCHGPTQRVRLASCESWAPKPGGQVDLIAVRDAVYNAHRSFQLQAVYYDPFQAELMAQELRRQGVTMTPMEFVGRNLNTMANCLLQTFRNRKIDLFDDKSLVRDLYRLTIEEKSYGHRLSAVKDEYGHADRATALAIALPHASALAASGYGTTIVLAAPLQGPRISGGGCYGPW